MHRYAYVFFTAAILKIFPEFFADLHIGRGLFQLCGFEILAGERMRKGPLQKTAVLKWEGSITLPPFRPRCIINRRAQQERASIRCYGLEKALPRNQEIV